MPADIATKFSWISQHATGMKLSMRETRTINVVDVVADLKRHRIRDNTKGDVKHRIQLTNGKYFCFLWWGALSNNVRLSALCKLDNLSFTYVTFYMFL